MKKDTESLVNAIVDGIQDKKGHKIIVADLSNIITAPAQCFIIAEGNSPQQVNAIVDRVVEKAFETRHEKPATVTGESLAEWVVIDYGTVVVHIFLPDVRNYYDLENLYDDSDITAIPDLD